MLSNKSKNNNQKKFRQAATIEEAEEEDFKTFPLPYQLKEHDIMCGRGGLADTHVGNERFREHVAELCRTYMSKKVDKFIKRGILTTIFERVDSKGGRFLKQDGSEYRQICKKYAREKIAHALRDTWLKQIGDVSVDARVSKKAKAKEQQQQQRQSSNVNKNHPRGKTTRRNRGKAAKKYREESPSSDKSYSEDESVDSANTTNNEGSPEEFMRKRPQIVCKPRKKPKLSPATHQEGDGRRNNSPLQSTEASSNAPVLYPPTLLIDHQAMTSSTETSTVEPPSLSGLEVLAAHHQRVLLAIQKEKEQLSSLTGRLFPQAAGEIPNHVTPNTEDKEILGLQTTTAATALGLIPPTFPARASTTLTNVVADHRLAASTHGRLLPLMEHNDSRNSDPWLPRLTSSSTISSTTPRTTIGSDLLRQDFYSGTTTKKDQRIRLPQLFPTEFRNSTASLSRNLVHQSYQQSPPPFQKEGGDEEDERVSCWDSWH